MLLTIAALLTVFWMLGLMAGYATVSFIHGLSVMAFVLLLVSLIREINIYRELNHLLSNRNGRSADKGERR